MLMSALRSGGEDICCIGESHSVIWWIWWRRKGNVRHFTHHLNVLIYLATWLYHFPCIFLVFLAASNFQHTKRTNVHMIHNLSVEASKQIWLITLTDMLIKWCYINIAMNKIYNIHMTPWKRRRAHIRQPLHKISSLAEFMCSIKRWMN